MEKFRKYFLAALFILMVGTICLGACSSAPAQVVEPTATTQISSPTPVEEVETAAAPVEEPEMVDQCISCHTEKQMLVDTAKPEEEVISENEGAG
jgi:hypothetical protein